MRLRGGHLGEDLRAGLVLGVESVPDGLASGLLAGVNPAFGLYAYFVGPIAGAVATSSVIMSVQATGAMSVIVADVDAVHSGAHADRALFTLSVLTGVLMLAAGLLRLGRLVRFVPNSVLTGFVNAVAINIVLGQLSNATGYSGQGANRVLRAIDTVVHLRSWNWPTVAIAVLTILLIVVLERTRVGSLGLVAAVVATSALVYLAHLGSVEVLNDSALVPTTLPRLVLPDPRLVLELLVPALSLALVGLVQGAAISNSIPQPDGTYADPSGDFRGQGVANIAAGLLQGMPVGGSMSATAILRTAGGRGRLANVFTSVVIALCILVLGPLVGYVAMPALAGLLILIGVRSFKAENMVMVWHTGRTQSVTMLTTFVLTLIIPLQYAVLVGVGLSIVLHVAQQSNQVKVVRWVFDSPALPPLETTPPERLAGGELVVLQPYGSLFFAAAPTFESQLPQVGPESAGAVVVLRLRGKQELGSTFITVVQRYGRALNANGARLLLSGISPTVHAQLHATGTEELLGPDSVFDARPRVNESLHAAMAAAADWQARSRASDA